MLTKSLSDKLLKVKPLLLIVSFLVGMWALTGCGEATIISLAPSATSSSISTPTSLNTSPPQNIATITANPTTPQPTLSPTNTPAPTTATAAAASVSVVTIRDFASVNLSNTRRLDIFLPPGYEARAKAGNCYKVLYMNDGADTYTYNLDKLLAKLYTNREMEMVLVVALFNTSARLSEYGVAGIPDYKMRGDKADLYTKFVLEEVLPYIQKNYCALSGAANTAFMGSSLGGLAAFDLVWRNPDLFGKVGVFSGSFWWHSDAVNPVPKPEARIMHKVVRETKPTPARARLKFWFYAGTDEEVSDRDGNGVIDVIQDTTELANELKIQGYKSGGGDIVYVQGEGGKHDQISWLKVLPDFLKWAFPYQA